MDETAAKALLQKVEDLAKQVGELGDAKQQLQDTAAYINDTSILVNTIMKDPNLAKTVQAAINGTAAPVAPVAPTPPAVNPDDKNTWKFDPATGKPINPAQLTPPTPPTDTRIDSLDGQKRQEIIDRVEGKFKYSTLKPEERAGIRKQVGAWLSSYNMKVTEIPVDQLEQKLSDAYLNVGLQTAKETGTTDAVVESYFDDAGRLPGMGSGNAAQNATTISPTQQKWAKKLDVPEDKVAAGLKELTETGVITYKPKEQQQQTGVQPSGTPTPPAPTQ